MVGPRTQGLVPVGPCPDLSQAIPQLVPQAALDKARVPTALTRAECWNHQERFIIPRPHHFSLGPGRSPSLRLHLFWFILPRSAKSS